MIALLNGDVDAVATYQDARADLKQDYPKIYKDTKVIYRTDKIPNDTISVRGDMSKQWKTKITNAFLDISKSEKVRKYLQIFMGIKAMKKQRIVTLIQ